MRYTHPELLDHLAASYVLGTLQGRARRRFEVLLKDRNDIAALVNAWHTRLQPLAVSVPPVQPSAGVWEAVVQKTTSVANGKSKASSNPQTPSFWWNWLKSAGLVGAGFAAALLIITVAPLTLTSVDKVAEQAQKLPQSYVGLLTDANGQAAVLASSLRQGKVLTVKILKPTPIPAGSQLLLWALPNEGAPFLLGVLPEKKSAVIQMPATSEQLLAQVPRLIVTAEPLGNATVKPTGTPLLSGHCVKLW
ncbi:MAG: anti-sigma factor [Burkholderiaceae bacterium]|nr:anti-sigma factor [Burkholderiaceae bacterium]